MTKKKKGAVIGISCAAATVAAAGGVFFADYIAARNVCTVTKEAVSGKTLVDSGIDSYISRLKKLDAGTADLFVCQLSTNDVSQRKPLGSVSESSEIEAFDTSTVAGAIEYIIAYAKQAWDARWCSTPTPGMTAKHTPPWWGCWRKSRASGTLESLICGMMIPSIPLRMNSAPCTWRTASTPPRPDIWRVDTLYGRIFD